MTDCTAASFVSLVRKRCVCGSRRDDVRERIEKECVTGGGVAMDLKEAGEEMSK